MSGTVCAKVSPANLPPAPGTLASPSPANGSSHGIYHARQDRASCQRRRPWLRRVQPAGAEHRRHRGQRDRDHPLGARSRGERARHGGAVRHRGRGRQGAEGRAARQRGDRHQSVGAPRRRALHAGTRGGQPGQLLARAWRRVHRRVPASCGTAVGLRLRARHDRAGTPAGKRNEESSASSASPRHRPTTSNIKCCCVRCPTGCGTW